MWRITKQAPSGASGRRIAILGAIGFACFYACFGFFAPEMFPGASETRFLNLVIGLVFGVSEGYFVANYSIGREFGFILSVVYFAIFFLIIY